MTLRLPTQTPPSGASAGYLSAAGDQTVEEFDPLAPADTNTDAPAIDTSSTPGPQVEDTYGDTHSHQPISADLTLLAAAGSAIDPKYLAAVMGNVLGDALAKAKTYIGGIIAKFSVTGTKPSSYPWGAVIAEIGDGVTAADAAVVAVLGGDSAVTTARAAFSVDQQNSVPGSKFAYGLDLAGVGTHDGYPAVSYSVSPIRLPADTPTSDPLVAGAVYIDSGTLKVSAG